jgi:coenzyme F420-reducing hydrogenase alpha subunit
MARTIRVNTLTRVEGAARLRVTLRGAEVVDVGLDIYEPPRFFEALLRGRGFAEAPDITARICGIGPVAYQLTACRALERALAVTPPDGMGRMRRMLYAGEWVASHAVHVFLLHLPDLLGFAGAALHRNLVARSNKFCDGVRNKSNASLAWNGFAQDADSHVSSFRSF